MGYRTVVVLSNDSAHLWTKDPELGQKVFDAGFQQATTFPYGEVVEQVHADTQTLAVLDAYGGHELVHTSWHPGQTKEARDLVLLQKLADKLGYVISRKD